MLATDTETALILVPPYTETVPTEPGGYDAVRFNALRHGILCRYTVLGHESSDNCPAGLARGVLCNANGLSLLSGMQAVVLSGAQPLQREVLALAAKHPRRMPPPL